MRMTFIVLVFYFGMYLALAVVAACAMSVGVLGDMCGKWGKLTALQWCAVPFVMIYHALWHGLQWPKYAWIDYQYQHKLRVDIRRLSVEFELRRCH